MDDGSASQLHIFIDMFITAPCGVTAVADHPAVDQPRGHKHFSAGIGYGLLYLARRMLCCS